jgi:predicted O-methyltransferase YrrM
MTVEDLLRDRPKFHKRQRGYVAYPLVEEALRYIDSRVSKDFHTLETGAGVSAVLFAIKGSQHICITPVQDEIDQIKKYCEEHDIPLDSIRFIAQKSEWALPAFETEPLDFVLIDGDHKFPVPFIDWYYTADKLKIGGEVMIDDLQHWTGRTLKEFLLEEPEWKFVREFMQGGSPKTALFQKIGGKVTAKRWGEQPFMVRRDLNKKYKIEKGSE